MTRPADGLGRWRARGAGLALWVAAVAAHANGAPAQAPADERLRLGDVYATLARESPRLEAARAQARAARARIPMAGLPPDPQLQLGLMNYTLPGLAPMDLIGMRQLQLMQMVPVGGKIGLGRGVARAQASAASARATDVQWAERGRAAAAFYELYQTDQSVATSREALRLLEDIAKTAEAMYSVGAGRQADVLRARVEIARMAADTLRMQAMRTGAAARLNALLSRAPDERVTTPALPVFPAQLPPRDSLERLAIANRPMLQAAEGEVRAAGESVRLARRELWPDLQLGVQYAQQPGLTRTEHMGSLMVGASIPVFARSKQLRMREEAEAMRQMAVAELRAMGVDTRGRVAEVHADLVRARSLTELYRTTVLPQAEAAVASALAAYRVGSVDFMTLLDDRMALSRYRQELIALETEQGSAWAELEMLLGLELLDPNAVAPSDASTGSGP